MRVFLCITFVLLAACDKKQSYMPDCSYRSLDITSEVHHVYSQVGPYAKADCILAPDIIDLKVSRVLYSFKMPSLSVGENIYAYTQFELTNDMPKPIMVSWYWTLARDPNSWLGEHITRPVGENITPGTHHGVFQAQGFYEVLDPSLDHLNLVVYAASGEKDLTGEHVIVEPGYATIFIERGGK